MISKLIWSLAVAYFGRSIFASDLFHRIWSTSILFLCCLLELCFWESSWTYKALYLILAICDFSVCVLLSPVQLFLFKNEAPQRAGHWIETVSSEHERVDLDIIAVHGLGSTPQTAWSHADDAPHWLRTFLSDENDLKARILLYYHNSQWESHSLALSMEEIARDLLHAIRDKRRTLEGSEGYTRPLLFIGYSFGGIIVKKAMLLNSHPSETILNPDSTACIFLGTPHHGSSFAKAGILRSLFGHWSGSSPVHLKQLAEGSELLSSLQTEFRMAYQSHASRIINCRETGHEYWHGVPLPQVVTRENANLGIGRDVTIDESHRELRRVGRRDHPTYQKLLSCIKDLAKEVQLPPPRLEVESAFGLEEQHQYSLLSGIPYAVGAVYNHQAQSHQECEEGTRVELLHKIQQWAEEPKAERGFWIRGMAGTGKSTVALTMATRLAKRGFIVGSFFFRRGAGDRANSSKVVMTIVHELSTCPQFRPLIADALHQNPGIQEKSLQDQWDALIRSPISSNKVTKSIPIILIMDAIDECAQNRFDQNEVVDFLSHEANFQGLRLRIIATSRPQIEPRTQRSMSSSATLVHHHRFILHEIEEAVVEQDIRTFFEAKFRRLQLEGKMLKSFPQKHHITALTSRSSPLFIAAMTSYLFISRNRINPEKQFQLLMQPGQGSIPSRALDSMYLIVISEAFAQSMGLEDSIDGSVETLSDTTEAFRDYIGTLLVLQEGLSYHDLALLISAEPETVRMFLSLFTAVLETPESPDTVKLFHQSFSDFLVDGARVQAACSDHGLERKFSKTDIWVDEMERHAQLLECCLATMEGRGSLATATSLRKGILDLPSPGTEVSDVTLEHRDRCIPIYLQYSCRHWIKHFLESKKNAQLQERLLFFLKKHFLHWIEAMTWLGRLTEVVNQLDELADELSKLDSHGPSSHGTPSLEDMLSNSRRFVRRHKGLIEVAPLQLYESALIFSPKHFLSSLLLGEALCRPSLVEDSTINEKDWGPCLLSFEGHFGLPRELKFFKDGRYMASMEESGTILVWDVQNGAILSKLQAIRRFESRNFDVSPSGLVAFCGKDEMGLQLWDVRQNAYSTPLNESTAAKLPALFSPNGQVIASVWSNGRVKIWATDVGKEIQILAARPEAKPVCLRFDESGRFLAVGYSDGTICVHDQDRTWASYCVLQDPDLGLFNINNTINMTWANKMLVSRIEDSRGFRIRYWDISSGTVSRKITCSNLQQLILYSSKLGGIITLETARWGPYPTGTRVMAARSLTEDDGGEINIGVFGDADRILDVVLSPDGNTIAGLANDNSVKTWNTLTRELLNEFRPTRGPSAVLGRHNIAFSPTGQIIATADSDGIVRLWDIGLRPNASKLEGNRSPSIIPCPQNGLIAQITRGEVIRICEPRSFRAVAHLPWPWPGKGFQWQADFSPSETLLAVWDSFKASLGIYELAMNDTHPVLSEVFSRNHVDRFAFSPSGGLCSYTYRSESGEDVLKVASIRRGDTIAGYTFPPQVDYLGAIALSSGPLRRNLCVVAVQLKEPAEPDLDDLEIRGTSPDHDDEVVNQSAGNYLDWRLLVLEYNEEDPEITHRGTLRLSQGTPLTVFSATEDIIVILDPVGKNTCDLRIWDAGDLQEISVHRSLPGSSRILKLCTHGNCVRLDFGNYPLRPDSWDTFEHCACGHIPVYWIQTSPQWLMWGRQRLFWLPSGYRNPRDVIIVRNTVVLRFYDAKSASFSFDRAKVEEAFGL